MKLIAEVKLQSPFGFRSGATWNSKLRAAREKGDVISIHTDSRRFGGPPSVGWPRVSPLEAARGNVLAKPILAKGVHWTDAEVFQAFKEGATFVLTVGRDTGRPGCWFEPTHRQLAVKGMWRPRSGLVVLNRRCLETGDLVSVEQIVKWRKHISPVVPVVYASGFRSAAEVPADAWGVIVGEGLVGWK